MVTERSRNETIVHPSHDTIIEALKTFPVNFEFATVELCAGERWSSERKATLKYDPETGGFVTDQRFWRDDGRVNHVVLNLDNSGELRAAVAAIATLEDVGRFKLEHVTVAVTTEQTSDDGATGSSGGDYLSLGVHISPHSIWIHEGNGTDEQRSALTNWLQQLQQK